MQIAKDGLHACVWQKMYHEVTDTPLCENIHANFQSDIMCACPMIATKPEIAAPWSDVYEKSFIKWNSVYKHMGVEQRSMFHEVTYKVWCLIT